MSSLKGYYSLVQYCPDESRAETANVGIVLFCPEARFLAMRASDKNERARRFFGKEGFDTDRLNDVKRAIENRLRVEQSHFQTVDDLTRFVQTRANGVILTLPRPVKVFNPTEDLETLFQELVETPVAETMTLSILEAENSTGHSQLRHLLRSIFNKPILRDKVLRNQSVQVPVSGVTLKVPYAFHNGKLNLIRPLQYSSRIRNEAQALALGGDLLRKHEAEMEQPADLWLALAEPRDDTDRSDAEAVTALFNEYSLRVYPEAKLAQLERDVLDGIH
jgi:hypothetical protein